MATKSKDALPPPPDPQALSESTAALLRELVAHLRQNRTQLREEWARRITRAHSSRSCVRFCRRSEEHTSELQSRPHLVCRLLLEKKKKTTDATQHTLQS